MTVTSNALYALGAWAAILGGASRIATAFIPFTPETIWLEALYAIIDVLMVVATLAIYFRYMSVLGVIGLAAAAVASLGFASIIGPDPVMFGIDFYRLGAGIIVVSMGLFGVQLLRAGILELASYLWLLAFAFALALSVLAAPGLLVASGVAFGAGFVSAGFGLIRSIGDSADMI